MTEPLGRDRVAENREKVLEKKEGGCLQEHAYAFCGINKS